MEESQFFNQKPKSRKPKPPKEWKVVALRECPQPEDMSICENKEHAAHYWNLHVKTSPYFNSELECFVVLMLNSRNRIRGHSLVSIGTLDTILIHPRDVFRTAIIAAAARLVLMHNHPSGDASPSEGDVRATRDLIRAGSLLKLEVVDHIIMGSGSSVSLRELGFFYQS